MSNRMGLGQNLLNQFLTKPGAQNQMPNIMRGFQKFLGPGQPFNQGSNQPFGQGVNQLFGPPGNFQAPPQQAVPVQPTSAPSQSGGWFRNLLNRFGVGK